MLNIYQLSLKFTRGRVLLLVQVQAEACKFTEDKTFPSVFSTF